MGIFNFRNKPEERYLRHLKRIFRREPRYYLEESLIPGLPGVTTFVYKDVPEKGYITGITYGLSLADHPDWQHGRPELCISVKSTSLEWARVAGYIANNLRGSCPFSYGQTINFKQKVSNDSDMDAFFIFAPSALDRADHADIDIGLEYKINIVGLYPMYSEELKVYEEMGLKDFWHHKKFDNYSVTRERINL